MAAGEPWESLSTDFKMASAVLLFVPVDECPAEEKHAKATKASQMPTSWGQSEAMLKLLNGGKVPSDRSRSPGCRPLRR